MLYYWKVKNSVEESGSSYVVVFSNVSNTTGSLTYLLVNETYAVSVQMCTRVGCGPSSQLNYIPKMSAEGSFSLVPRSDLVLGY